MSSRPSDTGSNEHARSDLAERGDAGAKGEASADDIARTIHEAFEGFYGEARAIPAQVKGAFERRDWPHSVRLSHRRLNLYRERMDAVAGPLAEATPALCDDERLWEAVEAAYRQRIAGRYHEDLATAWLRSMRRTLQTDEWHPVDYAFERQRRRSLAEAPVILRRFPGGSHIGTSLIEDILDIAGFEAPFRDRRADAALAAEIVNRRLGLDHGEEEAVESIEIIEAAFFRNRGAYLVGRVILWDATPVPLILSLENTPKGITIDAVLTSQADAHNIFSSTLANFHVTNDHYHEIAAFLAELMPSRPLGLHYTTIGYNHLGKIAVVEDLRFEFESTNELFERAVGSRGTVAIGFSTPSSAYVLKVVRDHPTEGYKWGDFAGVDAVLAKYRQVHTINRTGSMLDNIVYVNLRLPRAWFGRAILEELGEDAAASVRIGDDDVLFRHLIVQLKMIPVPVFLETAAPAHAEAAVTALGACIKNNAAADIFNKDLDARNYGVSPYLKVFLFDYDALEPLHEVKVRTNTGRFDGEEDVPDWFFEPGFVFLPEELLTGLRIEDRHLRRLFKEHHGELLGIDYWHGMQRALGKGYVPQLIVYPEERRLRPHTKRR